MLRNFTAFFTAQVLVFILGNEIPTEAEKKENLLDRLLSNRVRNFSSKALVSHFFRETGPESEPIITGAFGLGSSKYVRTYWAKKVLLLGEVL